MSKDDIMLVNSAGDKNDIKNQYRHVDENLFKEEFALAKEYFKKQDLKKKQNELNVLPYFNYFYYNNYAQGKEDVMDSLNKAEKDKNFTVKNEKESLGERNNMNESRGKDKIEIAKRAENAGKVFLKVSLPDTSFLINLNRVFNQYGYNSIIDFFRQSIKIENIAETIIDKSSLLKEGGLIEFDMDFKPDFFEGLRLRLTMADGKLGIIIFASDEIKKIIEEKLAYLKDNLAKANLVVDNLVIVSQNDQRRERNNYRYFKHFCGQLNENEESEKISYIDEGGPYSIINYIV